MKKIPLTLILFFVTLWLPRYAQSQDQTTNINTRAQLAMDAFKAYTAEGQNARAGSLAAAARLKANNGNDPEMISYIASYYDTMDSQNQGWWSSLSSVAWVLVKYRDKFTPAQLDNLKARVKILSNLVNKGTENHTLNYQVAGYLFAQAFPDETGWHGDRTSAQLMSETRTNLMNIMSSLYSKGYDEDLSTTYTATQLSPYFILYDCATDPQVKSAADAAITFQVSHMAANHFEGIVIPPFNRENSPQFNKHNGGTWNPVLQWIYWLYWGEVQNRVPTLSNFRTNEENRWLIHAALSDWRPSAAINSLAFGKTVPYELTSTKPNFGHYGTGGAGEYERYVYRDHLYAMGSGNLRFRPNGYFNDYNMFGLIYKSEFTYNNIDCHHHYWRSNHRIWKGASPFVQMAQHKSTAIILFDIPDTDPWFDRGNDGWKNLRNNHFNNLIKEGLLRYPKSINEKVEASGWIFLRHGDVYIAIRPLKDYTIVTNYSTLMKKPGNQGLDTYVDVALYYNVVRSAFAQTGFVIDVATKEEFASFAAFQSAVSAKTVSVDWTNFSVSYTNLRGDNLTARWNAPVPDYKDVPDSHEGNVNAQVWIRPNFTINSTAVAIDSDFTDAKAVIKSSSIELVNRALQINTAGDPFSVNWSGTDPIFSAGTTTYYTVSYNANGGTGTIANAPKTHDVPLTLSNGSGFSRTGYTFSGWNTAANGSGTNYAAGESYNENESVTLYAMWTTAAIYTVSYNANGGTGTIENATKTHSVDLTLSDGSGFSRTGYIFIGWNTAANGSGTNYDPGALYTENEDVMLFAWWRDASPGGTSPLVHYKGDLTGSGFPDSSGRDNHGTAGGATQTTTTAKIGNTAMFIGGGNNSIDLPANHADFNRTYEAFTLSMWVNPGAGDDVTGGSMTWFAGKMGGTGNRGWQVGRRNASQADFRQMHFGYSEDAVGTWGGLTSNSIVPADQWTHFAVTFYSDQFVRLYINGVLDKEVIHSVETPVRARINGVNNAMFQVGNRGDNHSLSTLGHIDDFGLWDVALTGEQIQQIYSKGNTEGLDLQVALGAETYLDQVVYDRIDIYPNPFNTFIRINVQEQSRLNIYDVSGILRFTSILKEGLNDIKTDMLDKGLYVAEVVNAGFSYKQLIIK